MEYFRLFQFGTSPQHIDQQEQFLRAVMTAETEGPDYVGVDTVVTQWRRYCSFFAYTRYEPLAINVTTVGELTVVEVDSIFSIRARRNGVVTLYPALNGDLELTQKLSGSVINIHGNAEWDLVDALQRVVSIPPSGNVQNLKNKLMSPFVDRMPAAAVGPDVQVVYDRVLRLIESISGPAGVDEFKTSCKDYGQNRCTDEQFVGYLENKFTAEQTLELVPEVVKLLQDANKRKFIWTMAAMSRSSTDSTAPYALHHTEELVCCVVGAEELHQPVDHAPDRAQEEDAEGRRTAEAVAAHLPAAKQAGLLLLPRASCAPQSSTTCDPLRPLQGVLSTGAAPGTPAPVQAAPTRRRDTPRGTPPAHNQHDTEVPTPDAPLDDDLVEVEGEAGRPEVRGQVEVLQRQRLRVAQSLVLPVALPEAVHHQRPAASAPQMGEGSGGHEPREPQRRDDAAADVVGGVHAPPRGQQEAAACAGHAGGRK
ncbi:hypothetical protein ON010_g4463 [Phytophthora cinnamomi]|nr:hypothetical protein ON010_g4463 [Phytophthora cinnamomi]